MPLRRTWAASLRRFPASLPHGPFAASLAALCLLLGSFTGAQAQPITWQSAIQAGGSTGDIGTGIAVDAAGNKYVTGLFTGSATFGGVTLSSTGNRDMFLAKYDADDVLQWVRQAGGSGTAGASGAAVALGPDGDLYVTGTFRGTVSFDGLARTSNSAADLFVARYDSAGTVRWVAQASGMSFGYLAGIAVDAAGNAYVTSRFLGTATFGSVPPTALTAAGPADAFFAKYDPQGGCVWARQAHSTFLAAARSIAVDAAGDPVAVGTFTGQLTFGSTTLSSTANASMFLVKFATDGSPLWARGTTGTGPADGTGLAVDPAGNTYATAYFAGTAGFGEGLAVTSMGSYYNYFVAKYDPAGTPQWATQGGGVTDDETRAIAVDALGNSYVTGFQGALNRFRNSGPEVFVAKYDPAGALQWLETAGGSPDNIGNALAVDPRGAVHVTGYFTGVAAFGLLPPLSAPGMPTPQEIFVAKLGPCATPPEVTLHPSLTVTAAPNHGYVTLTVTDMVSSVVAGCDPALGVGDVVIRAATSDEAENAPGSGNTLNDLVIAADCRSVQVRCERAGNGNGRVYTVWLAVTDTSGNTTNSSFTVSIPKSANSGPALDDGPHYTVLGPCN